MTIQIPTKRHCVLWNISIAFDRRLQRSVVKPEGLGIAFLSLRVSYCFARLSFATVFLAYICTVAMSPAAMMSTSRLQSLTKGEVARHNSKHDVYLVIRNKVYDCTNFLDEHP